MRKEHSVSVDLPVDEDGRYDQEDDDRAENNAEDGVARERCNRPRGRSNQWHYLVRTPPSALCLQLHAWLLLTVVRTQRVVKTTGGCVRWGIGSASCPVYLRSRYILQGPGGPNVMGHGLQQKEQGTERGFTNC
jgi:hypothetical protein